MANAVGDEAKAEREFSGSGENGGSTEMEDLLRCFICFGRVNNAHLCPSCSKMCCRHCIVKWLTERQPQCPHCRCNLQVSQLVNCRFVADLSKVVDRIQGSHVKALREECPEHRNDLLYFCRTCQEAICSDCAMFDVKHKGHQFERLSEVHQSHSELVQNEITRVEKRLQILRNLEGQIEANIAGVKQNKNSRAQELTEALKDMDARLVGQLHSKLSLLLVQKNEVLKEANLLESIAHELKCHLDTSLCPKSELIRKSSDLLRMTREIHDKPMSQFCREHVSDHFVSELVPEFCGAEFCISHFSTIRRSHEIVYSTPFSLHGLKWRLKVYPNGNGMARDNFLSVFLELQMGFGHVNYEYRVQMINHRNPGKMLTRTFSSVFDIGECWGYNRFFRIDALKPDGYLNDEDVLVLRFEVRPPSFYMADQERARYIDFLEKSERAHLRTIRKLKKRLSLLSQPLNGGGLPPDILSCGYSLSEESEGEERETTDCTAELQLLGDDANLSDSECSERVLVSSDVESGIIESGCSYNNRSVEPPLKHFCGEDRDEKDEFKDAEASDSNFSTSSEISSDENNEPDFHSQSYPENVLQTDSNSEKLVSLETGRSDQSSVPRPSSPLAVNASEPLFEVSLSHKFSLNSISEFPRLWSQNVPSNFRAISKVRPNEEEAVTNISVEEANLVEPDEYLPTEEVVEMRTSNSDTRDEDVLETNSSADTSLRTLPEENANVNVPSP